MAPRKTTEKPLMKTQDVKLKRSVRKKTVPAKLLVEEKLHKTPLLVDSSMHSNDVENPEVVPQKVAKSKVANKVSTNGMKTVKDYFVIINEMRHAEDTPSSRKIKNACKQNMIEAKNVQVDEVADDPPNADKVSKAKRAKATNTRSANRKKIKLEVAEKANTNVPTDSDGEVPPKKRKTKSTYKQNANEYKIMLANEVIRSAFQKKQTIVKNPVVKNRTRRQKRTICIPDGSTEDARDDSNRLDGHDTSQQVANDINKSSATTIPKKRRILSVRRKMIQPEITDKFQATDKGKDEIVETEPCYNMVVLNNSNESTAPDSTSKNNNGTESHNQSKIRHRKNSGNSTSTCFSWTKDISSSSTTTCVTVKSKDFVRIDNKLPIVKLTNVDHKIERKNSVDSHVKKPECPSECDVSISNLNVSQTLKLSTSSLTSVTTNRASQNDRAVQGNTNERLLKLQRSLENLACKMKNFDLEIINWIGYENESQDANVENIHSRILEVLHEESEVIRYCKDIKRVLVGDQRPTNAIECRDDIQIAHTEPNTGDNLAVKDCSKDIMDDVDELNKDAYETVSEIRTSNLAKNIPESDDIINEDKDIKDSDNDDDDALSLFAESITGLESSRKNCSFGISVANDKSVTRPDCSKSNDRLLEHSHDVIHRDPRNNVEMDEDLDTFRRVHNVRKETADSSTVLNNASDNTVVNKFQVGNRRTSISVNDRYSDKCNVQNLGVSCNLFQNTNSAAPKNKLNPNLLSNFMEFSDIQHRPNNVSKNFNDRSNQFQNPTGKSFPSCRNNVFNDSHHISETTADVSEKCNERISEVQGNNSNEESVDGAENNVFSTPTVEQIKQLTMQQLALSNKQIHVGASSIFKGICIFNLVSSCKHVNCNFVHKHIDLDFIRSKIQTMSEDMVVRELIFLLRWPVLKRKYGMFFVEECLRRNMTFWLLYLVKDFIVKSNRKNRDEETLVTEVVEAALLHLNDADLKSCADILRLNVKSNICMCDHLMKVISETQNFSRFKNVFINLALFMCDIGRSFRLDVATQVLERLCILPYDDALARALMKVIAKTNPSIFSVSMMGLLESQLMKNNLILYEELMSLKLQAERYKQNLVPPPTQSPRIAPSTPGHLTSTPIARADSPDTTNTDFVNKVAEPVITRTITINRTINTCNLNMSAGSESSDEPKRRYEPRRPETTWRNYPPSFMSLRPQRQVFKRPGFSPRAYTGTLPKFRWRPSHGHY